MGEKWFKIRKVLNFFRVVEFWIHAKKAGIQRTRAMYQASNITFDTRVSVCVSLFVANVLWQKFVEIWFAVIIPRVRTEHCNNNTDSHLRPSSLHYSIMCWMFGSFFSLFIVPTSSFDSILSLSLSFFPLYFHWSKCTNKTTQVTSERQEEGNTKKIIIIILQGNCLLLIGARVILKPFSNYSLNSE